MSADFNVDDLYEMIREHEDIYQNCGLDEVLLLMAEYIGDSRIIEEVGKYVDAYYEDIGLKREEGE